MNFRSMTGFGKGEAADSEYAVTVEIKSVNHRFKETRFKMASLFNSIELDLKKMLLEKFKRGSFDIYINYRRSEKSSRFEDLDQDKIKDFLGRLKKVAGDCGLNLSVNPADFLSSDFYQEKDDSDYQGLRALVISAFDKALQALADSRESEGKKLGQVIASHRDRYIELLEVIKKETPLFQQEVEKRLQKRFAELKDQIDENRHMQEIIYYLEKLDVSEEINRIHSHLSKLDQLFESKAEVGRQIDFLLQELNRETNTIGSKSNNTDISDSIVQMKVELEKIREQGLNIE